MKKQLLLSVLLVLGLCVEGQVSLDSGLVACYPFNGNANDMTGNGHNGTVLGATLTADRFNNSNSAYLFADNASSHIAISNFGSIIHSNDISISFWSQTNSNTSNEPFLAIPDTETARFGIAVNYTGIGDIWDYGDLTSSNGRMVYSTGYSASWEHYVFLVSVSKNIKEIFQNGVLVDSSAYHMGFSYANKDLYIGGGPSWNAPCLGFSGAIDDIRIYNRALTDAEVTALYNAPSGGLSCTPLGVNDVEETSAAYIYSPSPGVIHMEFGNIAFKGILQVYNMLGQKIEEKEMNVPANAKEIYTVKHNASGMYLLVLTSASSHSTFKFEQ